MHLKRLIVALIVLPLLYLYVTELPPPYFLGLIVLVSLLAQREFYAMYRTKGFLCLLGFCSGCALLIGTALSSQWCPTEWKCDALPTLLMAAFILLASGRLFAEKDPASALRDLAPVLTGFLYIPVLLLAQWHLRLKGFEWILLLYGCVWASDSLAYYVGKGMGKRKLYYTVSPNKTVAGAVGSVLGGLLSGAALGQLLLPAEGPFASALCGGVIGLATIVGDLVESMFKRDAGVKDSGSLIPGHGGILDKIDGSLFAGPFLYWMTTVL
jgi:phosphatidate cytidylyltransferase